MAGPPIGVLGPIRRGGGPIGLKPCPGAGRPGRPAVIKGSRTVSLFSSGIECEHARKRLRCAIPTPLFRLLAVSSEIDFCIGWKSRQGQLTNGASSRHPC